MENDSESGRDDFKLCTPQSTWNESSRVNSSLSISRINSVVSLLTLNQQAATDNNSNTPADMEDILTNTVSSESQFHSQSQLVKTLQQSSPRVSLALPDQYLICPQCRKSICQVSRPPPGYFSLEQVKRHNRAGDCWVVANNVVYDVSRYLVKHPGGVQTILNKAGQDASKDFEFHSPQGQKVWKRLAVGKLAECDQVGGESCCAM